MTGLNLLSTASSTTANASALLGGGALLLMVVQPCQPCRVTSPSPLLSTPVRTSFISPLCLSLLSSGSHVVFFLSLFHCFILFFLVVCLFWEGSWEIHWKLKKVLFHPHNKFGIKSVLIDSIPNLSKQVGNCLPVEFWRFCFVVFKLPILLWNPVILESLVLHMEFISSLRSLSQEPFLVFCHFTLMALVWVFSFTQLNIPWAHSICKFRCLSPGKCSYFIITVSC